MIFSDVIERRDFETTKRRSSAIEGMLTVSSMAVMDALLALQEDQDLTGHIVEFGVHKGRSAAVLAAHASTSERLILSDTVDQIDRPSIEAICPRMEFVLGPSCEFRKRFADYKRIRGRCRFLHVDTSHYYRTTIEEMALVEDLVRDRGVIALDDFTNLHYSQVAAAAYKYLFTRRTQLIVFLLTNEKAYLCKRQDFDFFGDFILKRLIGEMEARIGAKHCLARTEAEPEYRAFYLRPAHEGEEDQWYGRQIFEEFYQTP